jgi:hypothetical protein
MSRTLGRRAAEDVPVMKEEPSGTAPADCHVLWHLRRTIDYSPFR